MNGSRRSLRLGFAVLLLAVFLADGGQSAHQQGTTSLVKIALPDPARVASVLTYTLTVSGVADNDQYFTVTDRLPRDLAYLSAKVSRPGIRQKGCVLVAKVNTVICDVLVLVNGQETVTISVIPTHTGRPRNRARATPYGGPCDDVDPFPPCPPPATSRLVSTRVVTPLELSMDAPSPTPAREELRYRLVVTNCSGCAPVTQAAITDVLPAGVTFRSASSSRGTCSEADGKVSCPLGTLSAGARVTADIVVVPSAPRDIENAATVVGVAKSRRGAIRVSDEASLKSTVAGADLALLKTGAPKTVIVGQRIVYALTVQNVGPVPASNVMVVDTLPPGVSFESVEPSQPCSPDGQRVTCKLGSIQNGKSASVTISVTPNVVGPITNQATVTTSTLDTSTANDRDQEVTMVEAAADVSVAASDRPDPVEVGKRLTYSLDVRNAGPSDASAVTLTSRLPAGVTSPSIGKTRGSCSTVDRLVTCRLGTIAKGASANVTIGVTPGSPRTMTNRVEVTAGTADTNRSNNSREIETTVRAARTAPTVSISDTEEKEDEDPVFRVTLSEPASTQVSVSYETVDGTATSASDDYDAATSTLVFPPGETERTIAVTVTDDNDVESNEVFSVRLANPAGAAISIADREGRATILDNDEPVVPSVSIADIEEKEDEDPVFRVTLSEPASMQVSLSYETVDGTATSASDYDAATGTLVFPPGETERTIAVSVTDDTDAESNEVFSVQLANPAGAAISIADREGRATILDNDDEAIVPAIVIVDVEVEEGNPVAFDVVLSAPAQEQVRVSYETVDGTATSEGGDYESASGTLVFAPGRTKRTIAITVTDDGGDEGDETFLIRFVDAVGASIGDPDGEVLIAGDPPSPGTAWWLWVLGALGVAGLVGATSVVLWRLLTHPDSPDLGALPPGTPITPRYLNLAVTDEHRQVLEESRTLVPDREYRVRIDIGELDPSSLVEDPVEAQPGEPEPSLVAGYWLEAVLVSSDLDVRSTTHPFYLPVTGASWVCSCVGPGHTCSEREREPHLYVPIRTRETNVDATVRCTVYHENNVLQTASLHLVVADGAGRSGAQRALIDYALSRHFTRIATLAPRWINILTNESPDGTHRIVVKDDSEVIPVNLADAAVGGILEGVRAELTRMSLGPSGDAPQYDENNGKSPTAFIEDLQGLALLGSYFWTSVVQSHKDRVYLRERLRRRSTIQVSRVTKAIFPWALVYDIPHVSQAGWPLCPLLARWDETRGELGSYPDACPYESEHADNMLCPYGFWGFKHVIEQPPSVRQGALKTAIHVGESAQAVLARSLELDEDLSRRHLTELRSYLEGRFTVSECDSRDALRAALGDPALPLVYFYCHGKWGVLGNTTLRVPYLEIGHSDRIDPNDFAAWGLQENWADAHWGEVSPLFFINGCHTAELSPESIATFVDALAGMNAAGVVGTEISVSQGVASEVAELFYKEFTGAMSRTVGMALYQVRIDLLRKGNVTGLIYTPFCSMDLALAQRTA